MLRSSHLSIAVHAPVAGQQLSQDTEPFGGMPGGYLACNIFADELADVMLIIY